MTIYRTKEGDMVDAICKAHYGREDLTPMVYDANPDLAALGPILPFGTIIHLPSAPQTPAVQPVRLWG